MVVALAGASILQRVVTLWCVIQALEEVRERRKGGRLGDAKVVTVQHPSPASPSGTKWMTAQCMDELVLASSPNKEIDRFLS